MNPISILDRSIGTYIARKLLVTLSLGFSVAAIPQSAQAQKVWDGPNGGNLATGVNWIGDLAPLDGDILQWNGTVTGPLSLLSSLNVANGVSLDITSGQTSSLLIDTSVSLRLRDITIASGAGTFSMGDGVGAVGSSGFTLGSTNVLAHAFTNNSSNTATINSDVSFGAGGGVTHTLAFGGTGDWTVNTTLIRNGSGTINVEKNGTGTLNLGHVNALGNAAFTINEGSLDNTSGAALTLGSTTQTWNGNFAFLGTNDLSLGSGAVSLGTAAGTNRTITTHGSALLTVAGVISNGTTANSLVKDGSGGLKLDGASTYSGGTTLLAGELHVGNNSALGTGTLTINGGILVPRLAPRTLANAVTVGGDFGLGVAMHGNSINLSGSVDLGGATRTISVANTTVALDSTISGAISNGGLTKAGRGTMVLTGNSSYSGATTVTDGTLILSGAGSINGTSGITIDGFEAKFVQESSVALAPTITLTQGTLDGTGTVGAVNVGALGLATLANGNGTTATLTTGDLNFGGLASVKLASAGAGVSIAAGNLTTSGEDGVIFLEINRTGAWANGANNLISFTSFPNADIRDFALERVVGAPLGARQAITGLVLNGNHIALQIDGTSVYWTGLVNNRWTTNSVGGLQNWKKTSDNLGTDFIAGDDVVFDDKPGANQTVQIEDGDVGTTTTTFNNSTAVSYTITSSSGFGIYSGTVIKNGTGTVTLATPNFYDGGTTINAGTLNVNDFSALGLGRVTIKGGTLGNTSGDAIILFANNLQSWDGDFAFTGTADGTHDLDMGTGTVTIGGSDTTRTVTVDGGTLTVGELKSPNHGFTKEGSGTLALKSTGPGNDASVIGGTLTVNGGTLQINRTDALDAAGTGDLTAKGLAGSGTITNGGGFERWLFINTTGNDIFSGTLANGGTGALGLNKQGTGKLTLTGSSSYTGPTTIGGGILKVQNSNALGASRIVNQAAGGRNSGIELEGGISLSDSVNFSLSNDGAGAIPYALANISGDNTINGVITMTAGGGSPVILSDAGSLTLAGSITSDQARTLILRGTSTEANTVSGVISNGTAGTNGVTKEGTGTWTLSGANTYTGATTVIDGTLNLSGSLGNSAVMVSGGTLSLQSAGAISQNTLTLGGTGAFAQTVDNAISGTASIVAQKSLTLSRPNTYSGDTTVNAGIDTTVTITDAAAAGSSRFNAATGATNAVFALRLDGGGILPMANSFGGNSGVTATIDVNNNGTGTDGLIQLNGVGLYGNGTLNVTGGNGYDLAIAGLLNNAGSSGTTILKPTSANLTLGTYSSSTAYAKTLVLDGTSLENFVTGSISDGAAGTVALTKSNTSTWTLGGENTYTGATNVNAGELRVSATGSLSGLSTTFTTVASGGTLSLDDDAVFTFAIGSAGVNHRLTGGGTVTLNGDFAFNFLSPVTGGESWMIVDVVNLSESFGASFTVHGFTDSGNDLWTMDAGGGLAYEFSEATGTLQVVPEPGAFISLLGGLGMLLGMRRIRRPIV